ncbi:MAG: ABC transporter substrate-binding protein [Nocardiopsaceae bacterium]|jgi:peptide/nickel transport system substrate-binding protein|nr:ABC transporter substrate-binding protein [Nocardiopsaceae bacterium]
MRRRSQRIAALALAGLTAAGLAACSNSAGGPGSAGSQPVRGGTLKFVAAAGPDHIDTIPAYYTADYVLERGYARQLLTYPTVPGTTLGSAGWTKNTTPAADVATTVPSTSNGGITDGGLTYTFHIKRGVDWNTKPPRQVVSADFLREYKAFCNPVSPVGNPLYYTATIAGLKQYCDAEAVYFANGNHAPTATNIADFQNTHDISGITTPNPSTIRFQLIKPAWDFLYMLAMPFTSARPVEYDRYVPNSLQLDQHTISDGPYQITSFVPSRSLTMARNPAWNQSTDSNRHQYVSKVTVTMGVSAARTQFNDMKSGQYDLPLDTGIAPSEIPTLVSTHDPKFRAWPGSNLLPYIVFNLRSPGSGGAMGKLAVRQAISYGVNKVAVQKVVGGPSVGTITSTAIPPGNVGFPSNNLYPTVNNQGNAAKCKALLAKAGYKKGLTLTYLYKNDSVNKAEFEAIQASLGGCGIHLIGKPEPGSTFFVDLGNAPVNARPGAWDMGQAIWFPDWFGNNGRTVISPLFKTNCALNTTNYGCFTNKTLDSAIKQAESAATLNAASRLWGKADQIVMSNAAIVPLLSQQLLMYSSPNVAQAGTTAIICQPNIGGPDITNVWLKNG